MVNGAKGIAEGFDLSLLKSFHHGIGKTGSHQENRMIFLH